MKTLSYIFCVLSICMGHSFPVHAQQVPDCDSLITPPLTDDMFFVASACGGRNDIVFTYEDFQNYSENTDSILGFPIDDTSTDSDIDQTSVDNAVDVLSASFGNQSVSDIMDCFDVLCSPALDSAQQNLDVLSEALNNANEISQEEIDEIIEQEGEGVDQEEVESELGGIALEDLAEEIGGNLTGMDLQTVIADALGIDVDCTGDSPWDELEEGGGNPFTGSSGVGDALKKGMEEKVTDLLTTYLTGGSDFNGDPNWFLGEVEGLGLGAAGSMLPGPDATSMINAIQSGVDLYNGESSLTLPLTEVSSKDISVPIAVSAAPGGFKVDHQESLLGTNMNISDAGKITRIVKGLPDEFYGDLEGYAYGYKRGLKPVAEFVGIDIGLDTKKRPRWLRRILCRILTIVVKDLLNLDITDSCGINAVEEELNNYIEFQNADEAIRESLQDFLSDNSLSDIVNEIVRDYNIFSSAAGDFETDGETAVGVRIFWNPLTFKYVNAHLIIKIPVFAGVDLVITIKFRAGVKVIDVPSQVVVNKTGVGYNHLSDEAKMEDLDLDVLDINNFNDLSPKDRLKYFNKKNSTRKRTDFEFFNPQAYRFLDILGDLESLFNTDNENPYPVYNTEQLDLEPDEYYYEFGGYSGRFYIQPNGGVTLVPYQDFEIVIDETRGEIDAFKFITPEGIQYIFDQKANSRYDQYTLPTSFKYPEQGIDRDKFKKPVIGKVEYPVYKFWMGIPLGMEVKKDYMTNYYIEKGESYTSAWHTTRIESLLSKEVIDVTYENRVLHYNASKNWTHTFPNFETSVQGGETVFLTTANDDLGTHFKSTEWKNGFADLTYSMSEVFAVEPVIKTIKNNRGKQATYYYAQNNLSLPGAKLCTKVELQKNNNFFKAWEFDYATPDYTQVAVDCNGSSTNTEAGQGPVYSDDSEYALNFDIGSKDENDRFVFRFPISLSILGTCLEFIIPVKIKFRIKDHAPNGYYYMNKVSEFGSLIQLKTYLGLKDDREHIRYQAEFVRNFLRAVNERDADDEFHKIAKLSYKGDMTVLPKRFSIHQDIWGNYNGLSTSMSPFIRLPYQNNTGAANIGFNTDHFAFKHPSVDDQTFGAGRKWAADLDMGIIGQLDSVVLETGAFFSYEYDLHEYPEDPANFFSQGGLRISAMNQGSENGPTKRTNYVYTQPTIINYPAFTDQHELDRYYKNLELRVKTSWKPLNEWQMNKGGYVGYAKVEEVFEENGKVAHFFTNPRLEKYEPQEPLTQNLHVKYKRLFRWSDNNYKTLTNNEIDYHTTFGSKIVKPWRLGLEYETKVYNEANETLSESTTNYEFPAMQGEQGVLSYTNSQMYQFMHYGAFNDLNDDGAIYQLIDAGTRCFENKLIQIFRFFLKNIFTEHPYRFIEKDFPYTTITVHSEKVEPTNTTTITYLMDGELTSETTYAYYGNEERKIRQVNQTFSNGQSSGVKYLYADNLANSGNNYPFINYEVMHALDQTCNYELPIIQKSKINGVTVSGSATNYQLLDERYLPLTVWGVRESKFALQGTFKIYNGDGMPKVYQLAKYATGSDPEDYETFPEITMSWNNNLLLKSRSFEGFTTSYDYDEGGDNLCLLKTATDANDLETSYTYDARRRLETTVSPGALQTTTYAYNMNPLTTTTTTTFQDATPEQSQVETRDGWGNFLSLVRSDDALLASTSYDNLFRPISQYQMGSGTSINTYEPAPISRVLETKDAVGNTTKIDYLAANTDPDYNNLFTYSGTQATDPNGHVSKSWQDAFGKPVLSISGAGGVTRMTYDEQTRIEQIINPIEEVYRYAYNEMGLLAIKEIPNKSPEQFWYDKSMRMVAKSDAANTLVVDYDPLYRLQRIALSNLTSFGDPLTTVLEEEIVNANMTADLLINTYQADKTWMDNIQESILTGGGVDGSKTSTFTYDDFGRVIGTSSSYSNGYQVLETIPDLNAASIPLQVNRTVTGPDGARSLIYNYGIDEVLRPTTTTLNYDGETTLLEHLMYNDFDQVRQKNIRATTDAFLQIVDYTYDGAGKLLTINSPTETACLLREEVCQLFWASPEAAIDLGEANCGTLLGVELDGTTYFATAPIAMDDVAAIEFFIDEKIGEERKIGSTEVFYESQFGIEEQFHISIMQTNIQTATILFENCQYTLAPKECCEITIVEPDSDFPVTDAPNPVDLFYEQITYDGLDISMIEMNGSCSAGLIRNKYTYDGDHRLKQVKNTLFAPHKIEDAFSSSYTYDPAGNILTLKRNGWVEDYEGFTKIDDLLYTYAENTSRLESVSDLLAGNDDLAQVNGFGTTNPLSEYTYDGNGNLNADNGKAIDNIGYNLLNLPEVVSHQTDGALTYEYTFGGEKLSKTSPEGKREYLGGFEYQDGGLEFIHIPNGRITEKGGERHYQYQLSDHLGNIVVLFEDKDADGLISIEESNTEDNEVIQRNYYYSFGMRVDAPHFMLTGEPRGDYLYNGKELQEELGLNWLSFGFREYDPVIGRFPSVDPIADQFAHVSGFNYAENSPIGNIDLWGLQKYWAANGDFIKQVGENNSMRIFNGTEKQFNGSSNKEREDNSVEAFNATQENEVVLTHKWGKEHFPKSNNKEWAMSFYKKFIESEDGFQKGGYTPVFIKGSNVEGEEGGREVDAGLSVPGIDNYKKLGWRRSTTIHTHPHWGSSKFSDIRSVGLGGTYYSGDIPWSLENGVDLYLLYQSPQVSGAFRMKIFKPHIFRKEKNEITKGRVPYEFHSYEREDAKEKATSKVYRY